MFGEFLFGLLAGTITGVTPALHVNTLASLFTLLNNKPNGFGFVVLIYTMGLAHTFLDSIPSTFLGVPDEDTVLNILPAHRLVLKGKALEVVNISLKASLLAVLFALPLLPIYIFLAPKYVPEFGKIFVFFLACFLILTEKGMKKVFALTVFLISGTLGILIDYLPLQEPYFHIFVGLFGVPAIMYSLYGEVGNIEFGDSEIKMSHKSLLGFSFLGTVLGMLASMLPAFTSSQAALIGSFFSKDERSFLTVAFSVNTSNFFFSLFNFYLTRRTRNGIMSLIKEGYYMLSSREALILTLLTIAAALIINLYGLKTAKIIGNVFFKVNYRLLNLLVITFVVVLSFYFDGILGILVLTTASLIGSLALLFNVKRTNCMGVLMVKIMVGR
ncbi:MAG: tripartite tricarboxylate transporter permease [Thermococcus sp.]|uniref:tripartite tricarboxylate transporter permease n=1 Tax=Thermococcus sp. TaxID=35749 RepID=UPI001D6D0E59|nr:tripartite tricarboxylate transporter permease [Thermococcus sp.]MBO8174088.1 tripartite tricarboxylate transporter permease [Thermococcus sp.]